VPEHINSFQPEEKSMVGKAVLITGAAGGLGSELANQLANLGADLVLLDFNEKRLNDLHDQLESTTGRQPGLYPLDLRGATVEDYQKLAETVAEVYGGLNGLVHCAAALGQVSPMDNMDAKMWFDTFATNLHGPINLTRALLPLIKIGDDASIVFTTDNKIKAYWGAYGISKAAILSTMRILADELDSAKDSDGMLPLTCNAIDPGPMRTSLRTSGYPGEDPTTVPLPETCAPAFLYLLSNQARHINGELFELA